MKKSFYILIFLLASNLAWSQDLIEDFKCNSKGISFRVTDAYESGPASILFFDGEYWKIADEFKILEPGYVFINMKHPFGITEYQIRISGIVESQIKYHHQYFNHIHPIGFVKNEKIIFEKISNYIIYNIADDIVLEGRSDTIDLSPLIKGMYSIKVNNIQEKFFKNKS